MTAQVNSDLTYAITNVKAGTVMDLSTADNCSSTSPSLYGVFSLLNLRVRASHWLAGERRP